MPNIKSAKKELRKSVKRNAYNKKIKNNIKNVIKKGQKGVSEKSDNAKTSLTQACKMLDKAAQKCIIKKNTKNRKKSQLQKKINKI